MEILQCFSYRRLLFTFALPTTAAAAPIAAFSNTTKPGSRCNNTPTTLRPLLVQMGELQQRCHFSESSSSSYYSTSRRRRVSAGASSGGGWFSSVLFGGAKDVRDIVKVGDPVLHEPAQEVAPEEIASERIQSIIDDMIAVMRKAPGVGLAAPQIGVPLKIIVLEDTDEYIRYAPQKDIKAQDRRPFDLLVIINPKLRKRGNKSALFFEGCLSVDGFRAVVERSLEVEVLGFGRDGRPLKVEAAGWQARILQHEFDHLDGTLYVDKMVPRTFRTVENLELPLATGTPLLGVHDS